MFRSAIAALALFASGWGDGVAQTHNPRHATAWEIGPAYDGRGGSRNMPLHPSPHRRGLLAIDLPYPNAAAGHANYITFLHGSLAGKSRIQMRYRVELPPGVRIGAAKPLDGIYRPGIITPYFQRAGDDWRARPRSTEAYRWYATFATQGLNQTGEHVIVAPLNGNWTAIETSSRSNNPAAFRASIQQAERVGFVLGGGDGYGHGIYATGPGARIVVLEYVVE